MELDKLIKKLEAKKAAIEEKIRKAAEEAKAKEAAKAAANEERAAKLKELVSQSGYATPRDMIAALMQLAGISRMSIKDKGKAGTGAKRKRMTAQVRDEIKAAIAAGEKQVDIAKRYAISNPQVGKVKNGVFDHLS
jgi:hypothetical protein